MNSTMNNLPSNTRSEVSGMLQLRLYDLLDLLSQTKQAHWTVKGPNFIALHKLFDEVFDELSGFGDEIAERIMALGDQAQGTVRATASGSSLAEYPLDINDGEKHIVAMSRALSTFGASVRANIDEAADIGDQVSADLFTEVSRGTDRILWLIESHKT